MYQVPSFIVDGVTLTQSVSNNTVQWYLVVIVSQHDCLLFFYNWYIVFCDLLSGIDISLVTLGVIVYAVCFLNSTCQVLTLC